MSVLNQVVPFFQDSANWHGTFGIPHRIEEHLQYIGIALAISLVIALPLGLLIGHTGRGAFLAINIGNAARSLPTLGLLTLVVLVVGLGLAPVLVALVVLAVPPILTSTYAGIRAVDPAVIDAGRGMGMTGLRVLRQIELPLALPLMLGGLRSAVLQVVATATIAAYVALGGLGRFLIDGLANRDYPQMVAGALLVAGLAIVLDLVLLGVQRLVVSPGISGRLGATARRAPADAAVLLTRDQPAPAST